MNLYRITNRTGAPGRTFPGHTPDDAIESMAVDAGYGSANEAAAASAMTPAAFREALDVVLVGDTFDERFEIDGASYTLAEMLDANSDTPGICDALRAMKIGETLDEPHAERVTRIR